MPLSILIVEDNLTLRRFYERVVNMLPVEIYQATSAANANELVQTNAYELVIFDIEMQDGDTLGTIQLCVENNIPVIAISANDTYRAVCEEMGVLAFYQKPFPTSELLHIVEEQCRLSA